MKGGGDLQFLFLITEVGGPELGKERNKDLTIINSAHVPGPVIGLLLIAFHFHTLPDMVPLALC